MVGQDGKSSTTYILVEAFHTTNYSEALFNPIVRSFFGWREGS